MSGNLPFVGRDSELETLTTACEDESEAGLYPVIAPSGYGKSALLAEVKDRCENPNTLFFSYQIHEPQTAEQFLSRITKAWDEEFPEALSKRIQDHLSPSKLMSNFGSALTNLSNPFLNIFGASIQTAGDLASDNKEQADSSDIAVNIESLVESTLKWRDEEQIVIIFDQFDQEQIPDDAWDELARAFRTLGQILPDTAVFYVGSQSRFYNSTDDYIVEVELSEFTLAEISEYLSKTGFDPSHSESVFAETAGHPFYVTRILQIASESGGIEGALENLPQVREERYRRLEERFLKTLESREREFLEGTCALPELRADISSHVYEADVSTVRSIMQSLYERAVLERVVFNEGKPVYKCHDLQRKHLLETRPTSERSHQHQRAAAFYAERIVDNLPTDSREIFSSESTDRFREFTAAGMLFEFHFHQLPTHLEPKERVDHILEQAERHDENRIKSALLHYFHYQDDAITEVEELDFDQEFSSGEIVSAIRNDPEKSKPPSSSRLYEQLRKRDNLNEEEATFASFVYDTLIRVLSPNVDDRSPVQVAVDRLDRLRDAENHEPIEEVARIARLSLIWGIEISDEKPQYPDAVPENPFWDSLEEEFSLGKDDWSLVHDTNMRTWNVLFGDVDMEEIFGKFDEGEKANSRNVGAEVTNQGYYGGLKSAAGSPLIAMAQFASSLNTGEEIEPLVSEWSKVEKQFADSDHPALAALSRDVRERIISPLSEADSAEIAVLKITRNIEIEELHAMEEQTVEQTYRILKSILDESRGGAKGESGVNEENEE